jgi:hypothetical protein
VATICLHFGNGAESGLPLERRYACDLMPPAYSSVFCARYFSGAGGSNSRESDHSVGTCQLHKLRIDADFIGIAFLPDDRVELNATRSPAIYLTVLNRADNVGLIEARGVGLIEAGHATDFEGSLRPIPNVGDQAAIDHDKKVEVSELILVTIGTRTMHDAGKPTALRPGGSKRLESDDLLVTGELMRSALGGGVRKSGSKRPSISFFACSSSMRKSVCS